MPDDPPPSPGPRLSALFKANPLRIGQACLCAIAELARARLVLMRLTTGRIARLNGESARSGRSDQAAGPGDRLLVNTVADIVPRIAPWLPWRSDCLVQALAAQHWLARYGIATQIVIGADKPKHAGFEAHAWLRYGEQVITGGAISRYTVLFDPQVAQD